MLVLDGNSYGMLIVKNFIVVNNINVSSCLICVFCTI